MKNFITVFFLNIFLISNAYAYLDPGTGSIIIQGIIAATLSGIFIIKTYWFKIVSFFKRGSKQLDKDE